MARLPLTTRTWRRSLALRNIDLPSCLCIIISLLVLSYKWKCWKIERRIKVREFRSQCMHHLIQESDVECISFACKNYMLCQCVCETSGSDEHDSVLKILILLVHNLLDLFCSTLIK
ncbi:hypothetical protein BAE44_0025651 [Dichanthelium oligosanthes]|uniref:Uncharacterized protein n=1 Tax=Dichanthelium oligosanthes TaxID=888268 RepID=A0A1E5UKB9_9POAL|nr:hypothetical protein BAE44_0025651 [Dichanthelium oligosanthes]